MANKTHQFKTNINCSGCVSSVKPHLDRTVGIDNWQVDTTNKDKILTVQSDLVSDQEIIETVQQAGFKLEAI